MNKNTPLHVSVVLRINKAFKPEWQATITKNGKIITNWDFHVQGYTTLCGVENKQGIQT